MVNDRLVSKYLKDNNIYPINEGEYGLKIKIMDTGELYIDGDSDSLIDLADLLVSLSQTREKDHVHINKDSIISDESKISELIIEKR